MVVWDLGLLCRACSLRLLGVWVCLRPLTVWGSFGGGEFGVWGLFRGPSCDLRFRGFRDLQLSRVYSLKLFLELFRDRCLGLSGWGASELFGIA